MDMMEKYARNVEENVEERSQQLLEEKRKTDRLLYRLLPAWVNPVAAKINHHFVIIAFVWHCGQNCDSEQWFSQQQ